MTWQPIETAPKDGTVIDIWGESDAGCGTRFPDCKWTTSGGYGEPTWCRYTADSVERFRYDYFEFEYVTPTHWMPLPDPPA